MGTAGALGAAAGFSLEGIDDLRAAMKDKISALTGSSGVGKSSLLNALTGVKGLARTSKTPGRTRCLNFFTVGDRLALCDLPGFGYAKMPHDEARKIASMMHDYIHGRSNLAAIAILIALVFRSQREIPAELANRHRLVQLLH